jgi:uncharacterized protein YndB with AHSA1/START domain
MASKPANIVAGSGDEAVQRATGKTWAEWLAVLDKAGAQEMTHKEIVAIVRDRFGVGPWWQQQVTVGYEQLRQNRQKGETPDGFEVSASKTIGVPLARLYAAFADEAARAAWLGRKPLSVTKATARKSLRIAWGAGKRSSRVSVDFYAKGTGKSMVQLQHSRIADAATAEKIKAMWRGALEKLKAQLEEG